MTLAIIDATATIASSTSAVTPAVPDGAVGDHIVWVAGWGTPTATSIADRPTLSGGATAGASHAGSVFGGGGTYGVDTGPRGLSYWRAVATSATGADDAITFTNTGSGTDRTLGAIAIRISKASGVSVTSSFTGAADTNAADAWAPSGFTDVGAAAGDLILGACAGIPDTINPIVALTWPGVTLGTQVSVRTGGVTAGDDLRMNVRAAPATAGASTGAPTATSGTTGMSGVYGILRLREASNINPTANAGADQSGLEPGASVTLDGSGSDTDGTVTSLTWAQISGPAVALSNSGADPCTFMAPGSLAGTTLGFRLTATDNSGGTGTDTMAVAVLPVTERAVLGGAEVPLIMRSVSGRAAGPSVTAISADSVLDRLGVQIHMASDFPIYANNPAQVTSLLSGLGARKVRDTYNLGFPTQHTLQKQIAANAGVKFCMTTRYSDSIGDWISGMVADGMPAVCDAIEGINEPDSSGGSWASLTAAHQQAFYPAVKAQPSMAALPVLAPALANTIANAAALGDLSAYCDKGNAHVYSGNAPSGVAPYSLANTAAMARTVAGAGKPVWISEQGYHDLLASGSSIRPIDEAAGGIYAPKILLENLLAGNERVYNYELIDQGTSTTDAQNHYGIVRNNLTPKPAYTALAGLLALLADPGSAYTPAPLPLTVTPPAGNTDLRSLLTGKRNGSYVLLLWRDVAVWNPTTQADITVSPIPVTVAHPSGTDTVSVGAAYTYLTIPAGG